MAHEIKNPLSAIKTFAQYLPEKYNDPAFRKKFFRIVHQAAHPRQLAIEIFDVLETLCK